MRGPIAVLVLIAAACLAGCSADASPAPATVTPVVDPAVVVIEPGLHPKMQPDQVAAIVLHDIANMEKTAGTVLAAPRILRITATTAGGVARLEPGSGVGDPMPAGIQWLVRAEGTFMSNRGPVNGAAGAAASGFYVIDDANGEVISWGYP